MPDLTNANMIHNRSIGRGGIQWDDMIKCGDAQRAGETSWGGTKWVTTVGYGGIE